jgi:hypothetical protein
VFTLRLLLSDGISLVVTANVYSVLCECGSACKCSAAGMLIPQQLCIQGFLLLDVLGNFTNRRVFERGSETY